MNGVDPKALDAALEAFSEAHDLPTEALIDAKIEEAVSSAITAYLAALPSTAGEPVFATIVDLGLPVGISEDALHTLMAHGMLRKLDGQLYRLAGGSELEADPGSAGVNVRTPGAVLAVLRAALSAVAAPPPAAANPSVPEGWPEEMPDKWVIAVSNAVSQAFNTETHAGFLSAHTSNEIARVAYTSLRAMLKAAPQPPLPPSPITGRDEVIEADDDEAFPSLAEAHEAALKAAKTFYDAASVEEALWTGYGDQIVPLSAEMRRVKAKQALSALEDAAIRNLKAPRS